MARRIGFNKEQRFKEPIVCLTNGISDLYFRDLKENGIRDKYNLDSKKILLYASRLSPEKHQLSIIKTFRKIHKEVPDSHLVLVGSDGPSSSHVKNLINKKHYKDKVSYLGRVPFTDLLKLYNTADLACLWSWIEAEGLVLIEAMAQGTPCVGANALGISNVIRHGKTGYLVKLLDSNTFISKLKHLLQDKELKKTISQHNREYVKSFYIRNIAQQYISVFNEVLKQ